MGHNTAEIFYKKLFAELLEMSARDTELQRYLQVSKAIEWADSYDTLMSTRESDPKLIREEERENFPQEESLLPEMKIKTRFMEELEGIRGDSSMSIHELLERAPKLTKLYMWDVMNSSERMGEKISEMTPLQFALLHYPSKDFEEFWQMAHQDDNITEREELIRLASSTSRFDIVRFFFRKKSDESAKHLIKAAQQDTIERFFTIKTKQESESVSMIYEYGNTLLHRVAENELYTDMPRKYINFIQPYIIRSLLESGAFVDAANADGKTPLHLAASTTSDPEVIKALLEKDTSTINAKDSEGKTPLHDAARTNANSKVVKLLLKRGGNVMSLDRQGRTPIHEAACRNSNPKVISLLLDADKEKQTINKPNNYKNTPLHEAARLNGNIEIIELLLKNGASVDAKNNYGATPLHEAAGFNTFEVVKILLENGASVFQEDVQKNRPLDWAKRRMFENEQIEKLLKSYETSGKARVTRKQRK